jgi:hypothetical protein
MLGLLLALSSYLVELFIGWVVLVFSFFGKVFALPLLFVRRLFVPWPPFLP